MYHSYIYRNYLKRTWRKIIIPTIFILLFLSLFSGCSTSTSLTSPRQSDIQGSGIIAPLYDEDLVTRLYEQTVPAVVEINTVTRSNIKLPFEFPVPLPDETPRQRGQGSGFFIDDEGHIITNYHVIQDAVSVTVILHSGERIDAEIVGTDPKNDIALIKVKTNKTGKASYLKFGDSDSVRPGQMAVAMGSPYGLEGSITVGVISGVGRSLSGSNTRAIVDLIQTDASINPGNSGGPLLNSRGEVIGINTAIEASGSGIGFAIPINLVKSKLPALMKGGEVKTAYLGIVGTPVNNKMAEELELAVERGVYILSVAQGGPAEKSGIKGDVSEGKGEPKGGGDVITAIDGITINRTEDIISYLNTKQPGDKIKVTFYRGKDKMEVVVVLGEWPD